MKTELLMEIGGLQLVETNYSDDVYVSGELNKDLDLVHVVLMPAPYRDEEYEFTIDKDDAKRLVGFLTEHFDLDG